MEKLLAVFLHFQIIQVNRNGFEELLLTFDPSQEQMIEVSRFQKLKILKRFVVPLGSGLILLAVLAGCSSKEPEVFFRRGERDVLKFKAIQACHGNFRILEETDFGPFVRAKLKCIKRELRG